MSNNINREKHIKRNRYWYHIMKSEFAQATVLQQELLDEFNFDVTSFNDNLQPFEFHLMFDRQTKLIVVRGKHDDYYYKITEPAEVAGTFLSILKNNLDGCYYDDEPELEPGEDADQLNLYKPQSKSDQQQVLEILDMAKDKSKLLLAGFNAFNFLNKRRRGYEYEEFDIEVFSKVDTDFVM